MLFNAILLFTFIPVFKDCTRTIVGSKLCATIVALCFTICVSVYRSFSGEGTMCLFLLKVDIYLAQGGNVRLILPSLVLLFFFLMGNTEGCTFVITIYIFTYCLNMRGKTTPTLNITPKSQYRVLSMPFRRATQCLERCPSSMATDRGGTVGEVLSCSILTRGCGPRLSSPIGVAFEFESSSGSPGLSKCVGSCFGT